MRASSLLIAGTFLLGIFSAFGQYYRFAAIDAARSPQERTSAVAIVTGGGVVGGVAGPFLGGHFGDAVASVPYVGAFVALVVVCVCLAASQTLLSAGSWPRWRKRRRRAVAPPSFIANGHFLKASAICAIGFAVMTLDHERGAAVDAAVRLFACPFRPASCRSILR